MTREALKLALEFIERVNKDGWILADFEPQMYATITAIKEALASQRTWVGLTEKEIKEIVGPYGDTPVKGYTRKLFDQIEAALRSKNT